MLSVFQKILRSFSLLNGTIQVHILHYGARVRKKKQIYRIHVLRNSNITHAFRFKRIPEDTEFVSF